jgi:hypothetical protein
MAPSDWVSRPGCSCAVLAEFAPEILMRFTLSRLPFPADEPMLGVGTNLDSRIRRP